MTGYAFPRRFVHLSLITSLLAAMATPLAALEGEWVDTEQARIRLVSPWQVAPRGEGESLELGLEFILEPGWHVYWINGGDAGYPPELTLEGASAELAFPAPTRYELPGDLVAFGYSDRVIYPVRVTLEEPPTGELRLKGEVDFVICESLCIPYRLPIGITLPLQGDGVPDEAARAELTAWRQKVPKPAAENPTGTQVRWQTLPAKGAGNGGAVLELALDQGQARIGSLELFFEPTDAVSLGRPSPRLGAEGARITVPVAPRDVRAGLPAEYELGWVLTGLETDDGPLALSGQTTFGPPEPGAGPETGEATPAPSGRALLVAAIAIGLVLAILLWVRRSSRNVAT